MLLTSMLPRQQPRSQHGPGRSMRRTSPWCYVASGAACLRCDGWRSPAKLVCCNVSWGTGLPVALLCTVERAARRTGD